MTQSPFAAEDAVCAPFSLLRNVLQEEAALPL